MFFYTNSLTEVRHYAAHVSMLNYLASAEWNNHNILRQLLFHVSYKMLLEYRLAVYMCSRLIHTLDLGL